MEQLELGFAECTEPASGGEEMALPHFALTEEATPGQIVGWWDDLVARFRAERRAAEERAKPIEEKIAALKGQRTKEARAAVRRLREERDIWLARAEEVERTAYAMFEAALGEFAPRLIAMLQAEGLDIADDDEMATAVFWDCLQRPDIEYCAGMTLREIAKVFVREARDAGEPSLSAGV